MVNYVAGVTKGDITQEHLFNNPFELGDVKSATYTSDRVTEAYVAASTAADTALSWTPVAANAFTKVNGNSVTVLGDIKFTSGSTVLYGTFATDAAREAGQIGDGSTLTWKDADGTSQSAPSLTGGQIAYVYDNIVIPQEKLPTLKADMKAIQLFAKARRIAVYYKDLKTVA